MSSSTAAAWSIRRKEASNLTNNDLLEALDMAVERPEGSYPKADKELKDLKKLMESS